MYLPFLTLCLSELLGHGVLHHLGVLLIQAVGAGLAGVLLQVDLADELHIGRPLEGGAVVVRQSDSFGQRPTLATQSAKLLPPRLVVRCRSL